MRELLRHSRKKKSGRKRIGKKKINNYSLYFLLIVSLTFFIGFLFYLDLTAPKSKIRRDIEVYIPEGASAYKIADILFDNGLIKSKKVFIVTTKLLGKEKELKSGYYLLSPSYSIFDILDAITQGKGVRVKVTIPEGSSLKDIANILSEKLDLSAERFIKLCNDKDFINSVMQDYKDFFGRYEDIKTLEGYLFSSTYYFNKGVKEEDVIRFLVKSFFYQVRNNIPEYKDRLKALNLSFKDWIILASIVEKEAKVNEEKPLIAGVFINRLRKGYKLQSCATVEYIYGFKKPVLLYKDLEVDSPYNTYIYYGLPPSPICSPSLESLKAVLYPQGDYLFFVAKGDGTHFFTKTYEEHLKVQGMKK
ncbi:MAG: endolytic transglycosylase MltG [Dictyoglomus thermophilum]|uniref:endolytic transglycosylase MltG n=1 Tax=Dictyoglomus thermophilum TaxID=14 RepID=UPI0021CCC910|nr:endolytic transglycosylase MltG [Dictyoglomus thermophilum]